MNEYYIGQVVSTKYISYDTHPYYVGDIVDISEVGTGELLATFIVTKSDHIELEGTINWVANNDRIYSRNRK